MLRFLCKNKCNYQKGQLASFFIVLLVVFIIMAFVTVNINKVAFIKTESANAVDAGALAAGSVMANLFNAIGAANREMEDKYWDFYDFISNAFISAISYLTSAYISAFKDEGHAQEAKAWACMDACYALMQIMFAEFLCDQAISELRDGLIPMVEEVIKPKVTEFHLKQFKFYKKIRQTAVDGRCKAIKMGHKFAFMNSGIGLKQKDRGDFDGFLGNLDCEPYYAYPWSDGQGRGHLVEVTVTIDPVDTFDLKVTQNTYSQEISALNQIVEKANNSIGQLSQAYMAYSFAAYILEYICFTGDYSLCMFAQFIIQMGIQSNSQAMDIMSQLFTELPDAWLKLMPSDQLFRSKTDDDAQDQIICWIEDIIHSRKVRVDTTQNHEGRMENGIWQSRYPETKSYSVADFTGKGQIHKPYGNETINGPILRHNVSIVDTDKKE